MMAKAAPNLEKLEQMVKDMAMEVEDHSDVDVKEVHLPANSSRIEPQRSDAPQSVTDCG